LFRCAFFRWYEPVSVENGSNFYTKMTTAVAPNAHSTGISSSAGKYLTFVLGTESYGVPVLKVREIIRFVNPTPMPQLPPHVRGVINLRGKVVPIVDLRLKFGMPADTEGERVCIIVVQIKTADGCWKATGMVVDGVEEVVQIPGHEIEPAPDFGAGSNTGCILGMAKVRGGVKTLLDIDAVLASETIIAGLPA
jgi:purine-binding chemotaxis protein CheW